MSCPVRASKTTARCGNSPVLRIECETTRMASLRQKSSARQVVGLAVLAVAIVALNLTGSLFRIKQALADTPAAMAVMPADLIDQAKNPVINPINTLWVLLGAFLVFGMQAGFTMLEAGMPETVRPSTSWSNACSTPAFAVCSTGPSASRSCSAAATPSSAGTCQATPTKSLIFMKDVGVLSVYGATGIPIVAHYIFQFAFADCASHHLFRRDGRPHPASSAT